MAPGKLLQPTTDANAPEQTALSTTFALPRSSGLPPGASGVWPRRGVLRIGRAILNDLHCPLHVVDLREARSRNFAPAGGRGHRFALPRRARTVNINRPKPGRRNAT